MPAQWLSRAPAGCFVLGWLLAGLGGCALTASRGEAPRLVWPPPPLTARIEFVRTIESDEDLDPHHSVLRRLLSYFAGGKAPANRIVEPMGLAVSDDGQRLYVSDFAQLAVFVFDFERRAFGKIGGEEQLARPVGLALDARERLYVVEQGRRGASIFDREGKRVGFVTHPSLERPTGIALDRDRGRIYIADTGRTKSKAHTIKIFDMTGELVGVIGREKGNEPGQFLFPTYLAVDGNGNLYVTDTLNSRVQVFSEDGRYLRSFGERGNSWGMFDKPKGVALDSHGNVHVVDSGWSNVQIFNQRGQVLLFFGGRGPLPGLLKNPTAIAVSRTNRIYVADYLNHRVQMYQLVNTTAADSFTDPGLARTAPPGEETTSASSPRNTIGEREGVRP